MGSGSSSGRTFRSATTAPYPERLRQQFEGVIWRFKTGGQWREMPAEFGAWSTVHNRFRQWRDAGVFEALMEGLVVEAAKRGEVDLSLVSIDSTTVRAHHDAAGMHLDEEVLTALEEAAAEAEKARSKGVAAANKPGRRTKMCRLPAHPRHAHPVCRIHTACGAARCQAERLRTPPPWPLRVTARASSPLATQHPRAGFAIRAASARTLASSWPTAPWM